MSALRKTIARRLVQSKRDIPHYYLTADVCLDPLLERRQRLDADGLQASVNDLLVKAVAHALIDVPDVNAQLVGEEIRRFPNANIAIAVATDAPLEDTGDLPQLDLNRPEAIADFVFDYAMRENSRDRASGDAARGNA